LLPFKIWCNYRL